MGPCTRTRLLTTNQAAERLGISRNRLDALRRVRTGPEWGRFEGAIRYGMDELDTWAMQQIERQPATEPPEESPSDG
jgi:hypothetical protein